MYAFPKYKPEAAEKQRSERARERTLAHGGSRRSGRSRSRDRCSCWRYPSAIETAVREQHADIVVMGTHGRGLFGRWLIGSVTQSLLRKLDVPILTVCHASRPLWFEANLVCDRLFGRFLAQGLELPWISQLHSMRHLSSPMLWTSGRQSPSKLLK